jgi:hypothetical protein
MNVELKSKKANDPTSYQGDNVKKFLSSFANRSIAIERVLIIDLYAFGIDEMNASISWRNLFFLKKPSYPKAY